VGDLDSKSFIKIHALDASDAIDFTNQNAENAQPENYHIDFLSKEHAASDPRVITHPYFWDNTGNVILQVGKTLFRLHGSNLACHSQMFADIIREEPKHDIDGALLHCSILELTDVKDFEVLLDAMENAVYVTIYSPSCGTSFMINSSTYHIESPSFKYIASLLRVSTLLEFPKFREFAIYCLDEVWPSDLGSFAVGSKWHEYAAETVALARDFNVPSLLKRALYELLRTPGFSKV